LNILNIIFDNSLQRGEHKGVKAIFYQWLRHSHKMAWWRVGVKIGDHRPPWMPHPEEHNNAFRAGAKNGILVLSHYHFLGRWSILSKVLGRIVKIYRRNMNVIDEFILSMWICISELIKIEKVRR